MCKKHQGPIGSGSGKDESDHSPAQAGLSSGHHPHTAECCCPLPDNFHGAWVIVLFVHPHDKHGCIRRGCTDDHTEGTCLDVGLGKEHRRHEVLPVPHPPTSPGHVSPTY